MIFSEFIALYLFFGGTAAGAFCLMCIIDLVEDIPSLVRILRGHGHLSFDAYVRQVATRRNISRLVYAVSFVCIAFGLLCLIADLGKPEIFYYLFIFPTSSLISIGSFSLTIMTVCLGIVLLESFLSLSHGWQIIAYASKVFGLISSLSVMIYTGLLLKAVISVTLWQSWWLPILFLLSALSCGCAIVLICSCVCNGYTRIMRWIHAFSILDICVIIAEAVITALYIGTLTAADPTHSPYTLLFGPQALLFWIGFVLTGLVVPLCMEWYGLRNAKTMTYTYVVVMSVCILIGGLCLRFVLIHAGIHMWG